MSDLKNKRLRWKLIKKIHTQLLNLTIFIAIVLICINAYLSIRLRLIELETLELIQEQVKNKKLSLG